MSDRADDFGRANSSSGAGTPSDGGTPWVDLAGVSGVESGAIRRISGGTYSVHALEAGSAVGEVRSKITELQSSGIAGRIGDANNLIWLQRYAAGQTYLWRRVGGSFSQLGPTYTGSTAANDVWRLAFGADNSISAYQNDVLRIGPVTSTAGASNTKHGYVFESSVARWKDFAFTDLAGGATLDGSLIDDAAASDIAGASLVLAVTLIDGAAGADVLATTAERAVTLLEAASAIELCTAAATRLASLTDSAVGAETLSAGLIANATLLDAATAADLASAVSTLQVQLTEAASAADLLTATRIANAAVQEAAATSDTITTGTTYAASTVEASVTAEALSAAATLVVQLIEAGNVLDQLAAAPAFVTLLTEAAQGSDIDSAAVPTVYSVTVTELAAALDLLAAAIGSGVVLAPGRRRVAMPSVQQLQRTVQMPAAAQLRRAVALYPA